MSTSALHPFGARQPLRLVCSSLRPMGDAQSDRGWRRVAAAILASTWDVSLHLREQRFGRVQEELGERRELLTFMRAMPLDTDGRRCLRSLEEAALESELAIAAMMGKSS